MGCYHSRPSRSRDPRRPTCQPVASTDNFDPLKWMPVDVWEKVLEYLEDPRDMANTFESCDLFKALLGEKSNGCRLEQVLPMVLKWLRFRDALSLRRVCKRIQGRVDVVLDSLPLLSEYRKVILMENPFAPSQRASSHRWSFEFNHLPHRCTRGVSLNSIQKVELFREVMEDSLKDPRGRPFVGMYLALQCSPYEMPILQPAIQLITQFQTKLAHLDLSKLCLDDISLRETYKIVRCVFLALPCLQSFHGPDMTNWENAGEISVLQRFIHQNPLPPLSFIRQMSLWKMTMTGPVYQEIVSKYGSQLEFLKLGNGFPFPERLPVVHHQFPVLAEIELKLDWFERSLLLSMEAESLVSLKLHLTDWSLPRIVPRDFCRILAGFSNLVMLQLHMIGPDEDPDAGEPPNEQEAPVRYPSLKKFVIRSRSGFVPVSLQFAVEMFPNLEVFSLRDCVLNHADSLDQDLKMLSEGRMYESTLWKRSHSLQLVERNTLKFTRDGYLKSQKLN